MSIIDTAEALKALQIYTLGPFEIRVLLEPEGALVGRFELPEQAVEVLSELDRERYSGVYVTPNPLVSGGSHGWVRGGRAVGDASVARSAWLLLDVDPVRPSGMSATDTEKARAIDVRAACVELLRGHGWPAPRVLADSGNGYHAMWRMGEGVTAQHIRRVLAMLGDACDTEGARVDRRVFNASRIWKLPGTWARKGPSTEERPHRLSRLEVVRDQVEVTLEQVEAAAPAPPEEAYEYVVTARDAGASASFREAAEAYCRDRTPKWPGGGGTCPACGHNGCFGSRDGSRWSCWSSGHPGPGIPSSDGLFHHGDALDLDAWLSGRTPAEHLRAEGYLAEARTYEPDPGTDAFLAALQSAARAEAEAVNRQAVAAALPDLVAVDRSIDCEQRHGQYTHDLTGVGNAHRFAAAAGNDVRYVHGIGWRVWNGTRWLIDPDGVEAMRVAQRALVTLYAEADAQTDPKEEAKAKRWADSTASAAGLAAMVSVARTLPSLRLDPRQLDCQPHLLNTPGGTVDLRTGQLREHRREDYLTQITTVTPDMAPPQRFLAFLDQAMPVQEDRRFLERFAGYCAFGGVREHAFVINWGPQGRNGKSTFWEAVGSALGDYAGAAPREMLLLPPRGGTKAPTDLVTLIGRRMVWASEPGLGRVVDAELVKALSGGDRIVVKRLYHEPEEVRPNAKITFLANDLRVLQTMDAAAWWRAQVLEWPVSFAGREDHRLAETLREELPRILGQIIRWAVVYNRDGLGAPSAAAKEAARRFQTPIEAFLAERCDVAAGNRVPATELWQAFKGYTMDLGIDESDHVPSSPTAFGKLIGARFQSVAIHGIRYRVGLCLRPEKPAVTAPQAADEEFFDATVKADAATILDLDDARRKRDDKR